MARKPKWTEHREDGVLTIDLFSWEYFDDYVNQKIVDYKEYIFRGQASSKWELEPTLDRLLRKEKLLTKANIVNEHLERFKRSVRGRRGLNPACITGENEWWALGQHFGLATPLLDWTYSPFVAAYFAFCSEENENSDHRVIYALQHRLTEDKCVFLEKLHGDKFKEHLTTFTPMTDENSRLVNQGGLFTKSPHGVDIETWVKKHFKTHDRGILIKILVPNTSRKLALINLNRMNINHSSLFPDLYGSSKHCNLHLSVYNKRAY
jgi:hypothetical protein